VGSNGLIPPEKRIKEGGTGSGSGWCRATQIRLTLGNGQD